MIRRTFLSLSLILPAGAAFAQAGGTDLFGQKPIVKAVIEGDEEKVRQALLKHENPNQTGNNGTPLIILAVQSGNIAMVETLLKGGAIVDTVDREGYTALLRAAEKGDVDIVDILLKRNAKPNAQTRQGLTALMMAARSGHAEIVQLLLDRKANPNTPDFTGRTAIAYARQGGRTTIEGMLRRAGGKE